MQDTYIAIGLMSGSSLDGLDICCVQFQRKEQDFSYQILQTTCIEYDTEFRTKLSNAHQLSGFQLAQLHTSLGAYFAKAVNQFIQQYNITNIDFICSHGQTVFHQPQLNFTLQIGCGATLAQHTQIATVADLRTADVAQGGQGAPIVPIAEQYLFPSATVFLNIGGICNISFHQVDKQIIAFDICAGNTLLNFLASKKGYVYDHDGCLAKQGKICNILL